MNLRRPLAALGAASLLLVGLSGAAGAGLVTPHDMLATPSEGPVGQHVVITNATNSPCGGQPNDLPGEVALTIIKPDNSTELDVIVQADDSGHWTYTYNATDQVGTYTVEGTCTGVQNAPQQTSATDFDYTDATFDIVAAATTTTTAAPATTTTVATAPPAVAAVATPALTG